MKTFSIPGTTITVKGHVLARSLTALLVST